MNGQPAQQQSAPQPQFDKEALLQEVEQRMEATVQQRMADAELVKVAPELEYLEDVKDDMAKAIRAGLATDYKEAYDPGLAIAKELRYPRTRKAERGRQVGSERASVHAASEGGIQFGTQYAGRRR
jgi:hypothetical protein